MDLKELIAMQTAFDAEHGWPLARGEPPKKLLGALSKDLVGLLGEVGEFAGVVKRLNLEAEGATERSLGRSLSRHRRELEGELTDTFIYMLRLAGHLGMDIGTCYLAKLSKNREKYRGYARRPRRGGVKPDR